MMLSSTEANWLSITDIPVAVELYVLVTWQISFVIHFMFYSLGNE